MPEDEVTEAAGERGDDPATPRGVVAGVPPGEPPKARPSAIVAWVIVAAAVLFALLRPRETAGHSPFAEIDMSDRQLAMLFLLAAAAAITVGAVYAVGLFLLGRVSPARFRAPTRSTHIAVEACAVWFVAAALPLVFPLPFVAERSPEAILASAVIATLSAVGWTIARGAGVDDWRAIGWHTGRGWIEECFCGIVTVVAAVPVVFVGALIAVALTVAAERFGWAVDPSHPLFRDGPPNDQVGTAILYVLACVIAPLTEETIVRGALYSQLRAGRPRRRLWSVVWSVVVTTAVFAGLHPQGWTALPVLAALGAVLALSREWRGSLIAPVVAHGLWNGTVIAIQTAIAG